MKSTPAIISFYTENTPYSQEARRLQKSCEQLGLEYHIKGVPSFGSWMLNCVFKPFFILGEFLRLKKSVFWIDADAVFMREPHWEDFWGCDCAVRKDLWLPDEHPSQLNTSALFFHYSSGSEQLLRSWVFYAQRMLLDEQQPREGIVSLSLFQAMRHHQEVLVKNLSIKYVQVFDHSLDLFEAAMPVILHYQVSRQFKKMIRKSA